MSQADNPHTPNQKAFLQTIVYPPAVALPAVAAAGADAELLRLGKQLDPLIQEYLAMRAAEEADHEELDSEVEKLTGVSSEDAPSRRMADVDEAAARYYTIRSTVIETRARCDADPDLSRWVNFDGGLWPITDNIMRLRARTLAGLAVQARAFTGARQEIWSDGVCGPEVFEFAEAVCAFLGVVPVETALEQRMAAAG
jgi:hypothetical protein